MMKKSTTVVFFLAVMFTLTQVPGVFAEEQPRDKPYGEKEKESALYQVSQRYEFIRDPEVVDTVREIGDTVARAFNAPRDRYHFYVLNNPDVNAFITPSGDIFLFSGQLGKLRSEDELAAVMAHEMGHREADHFAEIGRKNALAAIPTIVAMILSKGEEAVVAGAIAVAGAYQLHFSREMEAESDLMAVNALRKTAYDPLGMVGALKIIEEAYQLIPTKVPDHLSTHPPIEIRRAGLESILGKPIEEMDLSYAASERWNRVRAIIAGETADPASLLTKWRSLGSKTLSWNAHHLNGLTLMKAGLYHEAIAELRRAFEGIPGDARLNSDLGIASYHVGQYREARRYLEMARKSLPDYSYPFFYLAEMERESGSKRQASVLYQKSVDRRPELPEAFSRYGFFLGQQAREGEADYYLGVAALLNGEFKEALPLLREAEKKLKGSLYWHDLIETRLSVFR